MSTELQEDYKDKIPAISEEPDEYPADYQKYLDSQETPIPELDKWMEELNKRVF